MTIICDQVPSLNGISGESAMAAATVPAAA
jgi:hypothetical protein